jgi:hypothetical protein
MNTPPLVFQPPWCAGFRISIRAGESTVPLP